MENYIFSLPTTVVFGDGVSREAGKRAKEMGAKKVMLVAGKGVTKAGLTIPVVESLEEENLPYIQYDRITPNPRDYDCEAGYELAKEEGVDFIIAVGGGSAMDTAKAIATLMTNGGKVDDWCGFQLLKKECLPLIAVPTTAGSGSEVTPFAVITDTKNQMKVNIFDPKCAPKVALVDPNTLMKLSPRTMAATGIDAMTHAVEAYTCKLAVPHTDAYALHAIRLISENLRNAVAHPDLDSCTGMMLGSTLAGIAFGYADVAGVHCMAEALGGKYDLPHGEANAMLLPTVTEFNLSADYKKYADVAKALGAATDGLTDEEAAMKAVDALRQLCEDVGIRKMREYDIIRLEDFEFLAVSAEGNVSVTSNPRPVTRKEFLELFEKAYEE